MVTISWRVASWFSSLGWVFFLSHSNPVPAKFRQVPYPELVNVWEILEPWDLIYSCWEIFNITLVPNSILVVGDLVSILKPGRYVCVVCWWLRGWSRWYGCGVDLLKGEMNQIYRFSVGLSRLSLVWVLLKLCRGKGTSKLFLVIGKNLGGGSRNLFQGCGVLGMGTIMIFRWPKRCPNVS